MHHLFIRWSLMGSMIDTSSIIDDWTVIRLAALNSVLVATRITVSNTRSAAEEPTSQPRGSA